MNMEGDGFTEAQQNQLRQAFIKLRRETGTDDLNPAEAFLSIKEEIRKRSKTKPDTQVPFFDQIRSFLSWFVIKPNMSLALSTVLVFLSAGITHQVLRQTEEEQVRSLGVSGRGLSTDDTSIHRDYLYVLEKAEKIGKPTLLFGNDLSLSGDVPGWLEIASIAVTSGLATHIEEDAISRNKVVRFTVPKRSEGETQGENNKRWSSLIKKLGLPENFEGEVMVQF